MLKEWRSVAGGTPRAMTESVVADFVARHHVGGSGRSYPHRGRVVMSPKRLVLVGNDGRTTIPLRDIHDIRVGYVPEHVSDFFDDAVTIMFSRGGGHYSAAVEGDYDMISRFVNVLFKALLNGTRALVVHPASVGGHRTMKSARTARLTVDDRRAIFETEDGTRVASIEDNAVTGLRSERRVIRERERPILSVRHLRKSQPLTTDIAIDSGRRLGLLNRFLRLEYDRRRLDAENANLDETALTALAVIYTDGSTDLEAVLDDHADAESAVESLLTHDLVEKADSDAEGLETFRPTMEGRVLLSSRLEEVFD